MLFRNQAACFSVSLAAVETSMTACNQDQLSGAKRDQHHQRDGANSRSAATPRLGLFLSLGHSDSLFVPCEPHLSGARPGIGFQGQRTCGNPLALRATPDLSDLSAGTNTLIFIGFRGFSGSNLSRFVRIGANRTKHQGNGKRTPVLGR